MSRWRPQVIAFADAMEAKLQKNDDKGGWDTCSPEYLLKRLGDERGELTRALEKLAANRTTTTQCHVLEEAVDVANFAMMIADVVADLSEPLRADEICKDHCLDEETIVCSKCFERYEGTVRENARTKGATEASEAIVATLRRKAGDAFVRGDEDGAKILRSAAKEIEEFTAKALA